MNTTATATTRTTAINAARRLLSLEARTVGGFADTVILAQADLRNACDELGVSQAEIIAEAKAANERADLLFAISLHDDLLKGYTKQINWQMACRRYQTALANGVTDAAAPKGLPSKAKKHAMYGDASRLIAVLGLEVERPNTLPGIAVVLAAAAEELMKR